MLAAAPQTGRLALQQPRAPFARAACRSRTLVAPVLAELSAKGRSFSASDISVKRILGEGSFGQCFEASPIGSAWLAQLGPSRAQHAPLTLLVRRER
jgi:hypothetical protein